MVTGDEWEQFPRTHKWWEAIIFIKDKCNDSDKVKNIVDILIKEANAVEDKVLTVAVLQIAFEEGNIGIKKIEKSFGEDIALLVSFLTHKKNESFDEYLSRIFNYKKDKYIRKIVLAKELYNMRKYNDSKEEIRKNKEKAKIIFKYRGKTYDGLINKFYVWED